MKSIDQSAFIQAHELRKATERDYEKAMRELLPSGTVLKYRRANNTVEAVVIGFDHYSGKFRMQNRNTGTIHAMHPETFAQLMSNGEVRQLLSVGKAHE